MFSQRRLNFIYFNKTDSKFRKEETLFLTLQTLFGGYISEGYSFYEDIKMYL